MLSVGLVGLPNAGKSTLFNLLTKNSVPAENFPFCTIDPHHGIVEVPDERLAGLAKISNANRLVPTAIEFHDIAGLVKGASNGEGLGNQFLSHIKETDLILLVVRKFQNDNIIHVENRVNPQEDEEILMVELTMKDEETLEKTIPKLQKDILKDKYAKEKITICEKILAKLSNIESARSYALETDNEEIIKWRKQLNLLTDKPIIKVGNINYDGTNVEYNSDVDLDILAESEYQEFSDEDAKDLGINKNKAIGDLVKKTYEALGLRTYLTTGEIESRAWTFVEGWSAPKCAGVIHSDFEKSFIKADVVTYEDFVQYNGWKGARDAGKVRMEGKTYIMQDGDVVEFKTSA